MLTLKVICFLTIMTGKMENKNFEKCTVEACQMNVEEIRLEKFTTFWFGLGKKNVLDIVELQGMGSLDGLKHYFF